ncbi:MAG: ORC1-type DNA replication protein [Candidatus Methanomethylicia archaeon]|jgi:cell division control protein 6|nr:ORC1-type DNA replication protein [Candidatus Methanomethylicia archaeon]
MTYDIILKELEKPSVFKNEAVLFPDYVPVNLVHREEQIRNLTRLFRIMIDSPGAILQRAILVGDIGVGKTAVAKRFGTTMEDIAKERKINLKYIHINCYKDRTFFLIIRKIAQSLIPNIPNRGLSVQEFFNLIWNYLEENNLYILLTLDEVDFIIENEALLYFLSRINDEYVNKKQRISIILITRNLNLLYEIDRSIQSTLLHNIIKFDPYTSNQLYDIIKLRSKEALKEGVIDDDTLNMIAEIAASRGDARYALELLWRAGKYADADGSNKILPEHVRKAQSDVFPFPVNIILELSLHEKLLLLSIASILKKSKSTHTNMGEVESVYNMICENKKIEPRKHTQLWEYIQNLKNIGIIQTKVINTKGRTTIINLTGIPAEKLESILSSEK